MERSEVINQLVRLYAAPRYLEVGVDSGATFFAVTAPDKTAVDPHFKFTVPTGLTGSTFFPIESDTYFSTEAYGTFDVTFLDGLHTFEQILKDFINAVRFRSKHGVIVIDDVIPSSYHASLPNLDLSARFRAKIGSSDGSWMGDVYRVVPFIKSFYSEFSFATVLENHGQLVLWPQQRPASDCTARLVEDIARIDYAQILLEDPFRIQPFAQILAQIQSALPAQR